MASACRLARGGIAFAQVAAALVSVGAGSGGREEGKAFQPAPPSQPFLAV